MRALQKTCTFVWLVLTFAGAARADELLVMPYACDVVGGRVQLTPSRDEGHRIHGQREQRTFQACSPANPDMCRQWTVHRFDLDCGGARVPWTAVVAAAADEGRGRRVWLDGGRLHLQMPPRWAMSPDDPCASEFDNRWSFGRMRRYCADRRSLGPSASVEMPPGFAPMIGIDAVFVAGSGPRLGAPPPYAQRPAPPPHAASPGPAPHAQAPPKVARIEPPRGPPDVRDVPFKESPYREPPPQVRDAPVKDTPAKEPPAKKVPAPRVEVHPVMPPPAQAAPPPATAPGTPAMPRIINRAEPAPPSGDTAPAPQRPGVIVPKADPPREIIATPAPPPAPVAPANPTVPTAAAPEADSSIAVSLVSTGPTAAAAAAFAAAAFAMLVMAVFAFMRRREAARAVDFAGHDFAAAPMQRPSPPAPISDTDRPPVVRARLQQIVPHTPPPVPASAPAPHLPFDWGDAIPRTRDEALRVLGMGVRPDTADAAIKKIVDGLRQSWHPDLASNAEDRELRELRLKQINAAWDIIAGRRSAQV